MSRRTGHRVSLMVVLFLLAASQLMAARKALIVGISDYAALPDLGGPRNDVRIVSDILEGWYGFPGTSIQVITDRNATRTNIERAFGRLRACSPNDIVAIYYSGHGTLACRGRMLEEALVPYDGDPDKCDTLITTRELKAWLQQIPAKHVDVVLDCCYSGGFAKDPAHATAVKCVFPTDVPPDAVRVLDKTLVVTRPGHVVISASQTGRDVPDTEFPLMDGTRLRTSALAFLMYRSVYQNPGLTHNRMVGEVRALMRQWHINQQPGLGGVIEDRKLFGGPAPTVKPRCLPVSIRDSKSITLMGGTALGVTKGARIEFLDSHGKKIAGTDVTRADWRRSQALLASSGTTPTVIRLVDSRK